MVLGARTVWHIATGGSANNGGGFDPGATNMAGTDLAATSATGNSPVVTSATYTFVAGDVGHFVFIKSGTNWTPGWYEIASVNAGAATLKAAVGEVRLYETAYHKFRDNTVAGCATVASPTGGTWSVDYSRKSDGTSKLSATDWSCLVADDAGRLVVKSATATTAISMIGNLLRVHAGTGWTTGYYLITACSATDRLTLERSPAGGADRTNGSAIVGGAANLPSRIFANGNATGDKVVAGNRVYIRGSGVDRPTSTDYLDTGYLTVAAGTAADFIRVIGYNGRPRIENTQGLCWYSAASSYHHLEGLYFFLRAAATYQGLGVFTSCHITNCIFDLNEVNNGTISYSGVGPFSATQFWNNEIFSADSGDSTATGQVGLTSSTYACIVDSNYVHNIGGIGIKTNTAASAISTVTRNIVNNCTGVGIEVNLTTSASFSVQIANNIINDCNGHGIDIKASGNLFENLAVWNNLICNCTGVSKNGINTDITAAAADAKKGLIDYNAFYNNTANHGGLTAGLNDVVLTADPFTSSTDLTLNNTAGGGAACRDAGFPQSYLGLASTAPYTPIGLLATPTGGGNTFVIDVHNISFAQNFRPVPY